MKATLRQLIAQGKTKHVLNELTNLTASDNDLHDEVVILSGRFNKCERDERMGLQDSKTISQERNLIHSALLSVIDRLEENNGVKTPSVNQQSGTGTHVGETSKDTSSSGFSWTKWTGLNDVKSWVALFAGLAGILTFYFKYCGNTPEGGNDAPFSVVVYTHGDNGRQDIINLKETKLVADFRGRREIAKVGENGQNTFNEVPAEFKGKKIGIGLQGTEGYVLKYPDSTYLLNGEPIYLAVELSKNARLIKGVVKTDKGELLQGVTITTLGESITTNEKGYFELTIPTDKQQASYPLTLSKKGFVTATETYIPQSNAPEYRLKKL